MVTTEDDMRALGALVLLPADPEFARHVSVNAADIFGEMPHTRADSVTCHTVVSRRQFVASAAATVATVAAAGRISGQQGVEMYGLIGKMTTVAGRRDEFVAILLDAVGEMPGCLSYVVAKDANDENAIWITEVWDSKANHDASLSLPQVKSAIAKGKPLIASFGDGIVTTPVGGQGLGSRKQP
jgi:quinol monooxygenase YgiN